MVCSRNSCTNLRKSGGEFNPFAGCGGRGPFDTWYNGFGVEGIVASPFEAWDNQLLGWGPRLARHNSCRVDSRHVSGGKDPTLLLSAAVVLDDELIYKDDDDDDGHDENCFY